MRYFFTLLIFLSLSVKAQEHCGYDFSSYLVLHVHEEGSKENIPNLKVTLNIETLPFSDFYTGSCKSAAAVI